jgi:hypothetical protein
LSETARPNQIEADARLRGPRIGAARWEDVRPLGSWGTFIVTQPPPPPGSVPPGAPPPGPPPGYVPPTAVYGPPVHKPGVVALRPLGLGDFFDGAFRTIRGNPTAMVGLAALVTTVFMVVPTIVTLGLAAAGHLTLDLRPDPVTGDVSALDSVATSLVSGLGTIFGVFATIVLNGMLVRVVAEAVLGRRTRIGEAWRATRGRMLPLIGLTFLDVLLWTLLIGVPVLLAVLAGAQAGVAVGFVVGIPLFLVAFAVGLFVQIRFFQLAAPALVLERTGVFASLRRAGRLSHGQWWRIFGVLLLTGLVIGVVGQVVAVPLALVGALGPTLFPGTAGALLLVLSSFLSQILVGAITTPFTSAVTALQYVDQRIRKEGLDVELIAASKANAPGPR